MMARFYLLLMTLAVAGSVFILIDGQSATANGEPHVVVMRTPPPPRYEKARNMFVLDAIAEPEDRTPKRSTIQDGLGVGNLGANGLQVIGVVISGNIKKAILGGPDGGELTIGQHVDALRTVVGITQDSVRLSDGSIIPVDPFTTSGSDNQGSPYLVPALVPNSAPASIGVPNNTVPSQIQQPAGAVNAGTVIDSPGTQQGAPPNGPRINLQQHPYPGTQLTRPNTPYGSSIQGSTPAPAPYATP